MYFLGSSLSLLRCLFCVMGKRCSTTGSVMVAPEHFRFLGIFATGHHENAYFAATHRQRHRLLSTIMNSIMFATAHRDHYFNDFQSLGERNLLK